MRGERGEKEGRKKRGHRGRGGGVGGERPTRALFLEMRRRAPPPTHEPLVPTQPQNHLSWARKRTHSLHLPSALPARPQQAFARSHCPRGRRVQGRLNPLGCAMGDDQGRKGREGARLGARPHGAHPANPSPGWRTDDRRMAACRARRAAPRGALMAQRG